MIETEAVSPSMDENQQLYKVAGNNSSLPTLAISLSTATHPLP